MNDSTFEAINLMREEMRLKSIEYNNKSMRSMNLENASYYAGMADGMQTVLKELEKVMEAIA